MKVLIITGGVIGAWILAYRQGLMTDNTLFDGLALAIPLAIVLWFVNTLLRGLKGHRRWGAHLKTLTADGWTISHSLAIGKLMLVFDGVRKTWAVVDHNLKCEVFSYDQFSQVDWDYNERKPPGLRLEMTIRTRDPNRPVFRTLAAGDHNRGADLAHKIRAIVEI